MKCFYQEEENFCNFVEEVVFRYPDKGISKGKLAMRLGLINFKDPSNEFKAAKRVLNEYLFYLANSKFSISLKKEGNNGYKIYPANIGAALEAKKRNDQVKLTKYLN